MGRPRKELTEDNYRQIETLAGYGLSLPQIAAVMGLSEQEFRTRRHETKVNSALQSGIAKAQGIVGKALFLRAQDGDIAAIRWWEMTRAKRRATQPENELGSTEQRLVIEVRRDAPILIPHEADDES